MNRAHGRPAKKLLTLASGLRIGTIFGLILLGATAIRSVPSAETKPSVFDLPAFQAKKIVQSAAAAKPETKPAAKPPIEPAVVVDGIARVGESNTLWDPRAGVFRSTFKFSGKPSRPIAVGLGRVGDLLRQWDAEHSAAGNHGDLYDNNDRGHSLLDCTALPQLAQIEFCEAAKQKRLDYGLQLQCIFAAPTLGNSSTAMTGQPLWRCQGRWALTLPRGPQTLYAQYASNQLFVYPEHSDHRPGHNGAEGKAHGDVLPANVPYYILSQGSSGSDQPFLSAVGATMAAFRPDVKDKLVRTGTLMPTVQMIFRSCNQTVAQPGDYLTGKAHPSVFEGSQVDAERMVTMAHQMTADVLPPMVQLEVVKEDPVRPGVDCFEPVGEQLFDTPCAIGRVARSTSYARRLVISAEKSRDLSGRPLEYRWVVLQGDKDRMRINTLNPAGSVAELTIPYHERQPVQPGSDLESNRVDIGVFVNNGTYYSAPGFVSVLFLDNQKRTYDAQQRIQAIDYADPVVGKNYVDPMLDARKNWRDQYKYDSAGRLLGWTRTRRDSPERPEQFTADGALVTKTDAQGRPTEAQRVRYAVTRGRDPLLTLTEEPSDEKPTAVRP